MDGERGELGVAAGLEPRRRGVPVYEIDANNADARTWDADEMETAIGSFIDRRVAPRAADRIAAEGR